MRRILPIVGAFLLASTSGALAETASPAVADELTLSKDGKTEPSRAKSTRVYTKMGGKWMLVHANFAPDPMPR